MNLADGQLISQAEAQQMVDTLPQRIVHTLSGQRLQPQLVIDACHQLVNTMDEAATLATMIQLGMGEEMGVRYLQEARSMFSRQALHTRLATELGPDYDQERVYTPLSGAEGVRERIEPLGVLLHIAAGNVDGLPVFSVLEGLLTGNINILKLPQVDGGLSINLLLELIKIQPALGEYLYVFDYTSQETQSMGKLLALADGVVVWGGDGAVSALRKIIRPDTKIIEWGHKISFAYVTQQGRTPEALQGLAEHICETNGLLCSSCQGIFLDTTDPEELHAFCKEFLPILETATEKMPLTAGVGVRAQITLQLYSTQLDHAAGCQQFRGEGCSLTAEHAPELVPSLQFRNLWVKPLARERMLSVLRPHKNHLQTVGLLCGEEERDALTQLLWRAGIVRITHARNMSAAYLGEPHDGEYPLRRYVRIVSAW